MAKIFGRFPEGSSSYLPLLLGYKCGLRIAKAFALDWSDIDLNAKKLTIQQQILWQEKNRETGAVAYWYFTLPKYNSIRTIELSSDVVAAPERERARQKEARDFYGDLYIRQYRDEAGHLNTAGQGEELHLVMVRPDGSYINSCNTQHISRVATRELGFEKFDYHSLPHPYVKLTTKNFACA